MPKHLSNPPLRSPSFTAVREMLMQAEAIGVNPLVLIRRAGLQHEAQGLLDPEGAGSLPREKIARLYAHCTWALDAHAAHQEGRRSLTKGELDLLCYCVITCRTLEEVIARTTAFSAMLTPRTANLSLTVEDGIAEFRMATFRTIRNVSALVSDLVGLSTHHRLFGWLIGEDIPMLSVQLPYLPLLSEECAAWLMVGPLTYRAAENTLRFPARYLQKPVVRGVAELTRLLKYFPFDLEETQSLRAPLSERLRVVLSAALAQQAALPGGRELCRQFSISPATLKRRLAEEGTALTALKVEARRELALRLLRDRILPIKAIAGRVGFSDAASFRRAFRSWTGQAPAYWRAKGHIEEEGEPRHTDF